MFKYCLPVLAVLTACGAADLPVEVPAHGGALCQGSKAWKDRNVCGADNSGGLCIKAVKGPIVIQEIKSSPNCPHSLWAGIKDTWASPEEHPRWSLKSQPNIPLHIQNVDLEVRAGESLFIGTEKSNQEVDSSRCYITWIEK